MTAFTSDEPDAEELAAREGEGAIEIETGAQPQASVIVMHGLGAGGNDFVLVVPELGLTPGLRGAPRRPRAGPGVGAVRLDSPAE